MMIKKKYLSQITQIVEEGFEPNIPSVLFLLAFPVCSYARLSPQYMDNSWRTRSMPLHLWDSLTLFSTNVWNRVDSTSYYKGSILYQKEQCRAAVSPNAAWGVETWGVDSPSKACRLKNNVVTGLADNERQRAVLWNTAQSSLSLPAQPRRLLKGPQKAAGELTRA